MGSVCARVRVTLRVLVVVSVSLVAAAVTASGALGATSFKAIVGDTALPVAQGRASLSGHHDPTAVLRVNVGLDVRHSAKLDALIAAASTPGSRDYGHYLTNAEYMAEYAPTDADVQAAEAWLGSEGLDITGVTSDNLLIHVQAPTATLERAFGVTINN